MRVNITANTCTIDNNVYLNAGEYNINKFYFTFSEEYLDEYVKKALFIDKDGTPIEMVIANNECDIPYDILKNPGTYTFGVYAYEMNGTELVLRYSPEPTHFYVNKGSYIENGISPTDPTPDEFAQYYQAMQDLITNAKPELIDYIDDNLPTIHVGETSTLTPGTPATVTNVGTERNPIFDFGIPQGAPGTTDYNELVNKPDLTVFALITESANKIALEMDTTEFKIKAKIFDKNNRLISESNVIDLPLESVVVSGEYDATNKKIILTLENGNVIEIPVEDLIDGLATKTELEEGLATKDANIIESISKNGAPLPVNANKNVNITVPTKTSEVINDIGFITNDTNGLSHYYNKTAADTRFSLVTETGSNFTLSIDPTTFVMTATLKDKNGRALSTQTVDLPLESVVVGGRYDSETREVVLTLENGSVVRFSVADLVSGLQSEITENNKLSSDLVDDTNSVNKFVTAEEKTQIATNENDISDIKDEQEIQNEHLDELDMIYNAFPTVSAEDTTIQLDNTAKVKFREIDLKGNTSQVVIPEEQGTSVSNTSIYVSDVNTDKENTIEMSGNTYQDSTTGKNKLPYPEDFNTTINGVTFTANKGSYSIKGSNGEETFINRETIYNYTIQSGDYLHMMNDVVNQQSAMKLYFSDNTVATPYFTQQNRIFDLSSRVGKTIKKIGLIVESSYTGAEIKLTPMIVNSSTATDYEPFTNGASPNPSFPQNIDVVTGTQNVKVCGKNLFDKDSEDVGHVYSSTGSYGISGLWNTSDWIKASDYITISASTTGSINMLLSEFDNSKTFIQRAQQGGTSKTYNLNTNTKYVRLSYKNDIGITNIQIEKGSTATTYEVYQETTYPINLGNIELCKIDTYQDRIYKQNDKWYLEKNVDKVILNGSETWSKSANRFVSGKVASVIKPTSSNDEIAKIFSDKFVGVTINNTIQSQPLNGIAIAASGNLVIYYDAVINFTYGEFRDWISTHNTAVYYVLATPTTTEITDTTLVNQLNALYNTTIYPITNINTDTSNLLPYIDLHYNFVTPSPSPSRPSVVNVVKRNNTITISNSDNTESQNYPINLGDMELCKIGTYQDYIYESNGNWFKKSNISKVVLNGSEENWARGTIQDYYRYTLSLDTLVSADAVLIYSNYYRGITYNNRNSDYFNTIYANGNIGINTDVASTLTEWKSWLSNNNLTAYYVLATPTDTQITDTTLITQLNNIKKAYSYDTQTNISQTNTDKPFIIYAEAIDNNADLLTDYVKNTDYASYNKSGVIKIDASAYGSNVTDGFLSAGVTTYSNYRNKSNNFIVSKGTLENIITGKDLTTKAYVDGLVGDIGTILDNINGEVIGG